MPAQFMSHEKNAQALRLVALSKKGLYSAAVAANSATGLGGSNDFRRNSAIYSIAGAFFVPAITRYGELRRSTFGCAGFLNHRSANLAQFATHSCLAAGCGGSSDSGATSNDHHRSVQNSRRCPPCNGSRRFTRQFQPRHTTRPLQRPYDQSPCLGNYWGRAMKQTLSHSTPEDIFSLTDVEAGVPIDAITCAISRADAVLLLLEDQFDDERPSLSNHVIASALWDVRGTLGLIHKLAMHADRTSAPVMQAEA
uniref:Uncharacterized protein n=1 Tax=Pseudomonas viridiflava TaxID=33069 RepID=I6LCG9_PSEVI|nr:hypothetical protein [Pseudomonas viridiflava]